MTITTLGGGEDGNFFPYTSVDAEDAILREKDHAEVIKYLRQNGAQEDIRLEDPRHYSRHYQFDYNDICIDFTITPNNVMHRLGGNVVIEGCIYNKSLSREQVEKMKTEISDKMVIDNPKEWTENVKKYNYRNISCIKGNLDKVISEMMKLANTSIEEYIAIRTKQFNFSFKKALVR